jgi:tripartite-type tricarboxylate transporter receptor subunit TctC
VIAAHPARVVVLLALTVFICEANARTGRWPDKPVRVIVPFAAGGNTGIIAGDSTRYCEVHKSRARR